MGIAVVLAALAACSGAPEATAPTERNGDDSAETEDTGALSEFYSQKIDWADCEGGECGRLTVPIDYENPDDGSIELALIRIPAGDESKRQGSLLVNPGGPGGSGVEYARRASSSYSGELVDQYDIVGFDPRGVVDSAPIVCVDDAQMDEMFGSDPTPDDEEEKKINEELFVSFAAGCEEAAPELLGHISTVEVAKDMDVLRGVLGESELDYLGKSYGTFIGATYAELFPDKVGRLVLDGAMDPDLSAADTSLGQVKGFEQAGRAYVQYCIDQGDCLLGDDVDAGMKRISTFLDDLDEEPLPVNLDSIEELTEGWAFWGILLALYDDQSWPVLTDAMEAAFDGDGTPLQLLANAYFTRDEEGRYPNNSTQVVYAVNCLDRTADESDQDDDEILAKFEGVAPTFGRFLATDGSCYDWPVEAAQELEDYNAKGAAPILVVGTTGDPATPYEWSEALAKTLSSGVLLSYDGEGHTAYSRSNDCIDDTVDAYLLEGTVPKDGKEC